MSQNGLAIEYAAKELTGNFEIVMAAVSENWKALKYATKDWKNLDSRGHPLKGCQEKMKIQQKSRGIKRDKLPKGPRP